jgi:hypothetical protein
MPLIPHLVYSVYLNDTDINIEYSDCEKSNSMLIIVRLIKYEDNVCNLRCTDLYCIIISRLRLT